MSRKKFKIVFFVILMVIGLTVAIFLNKSEYEKLNLNIGGRVIVVDLADTSEKRYRGLGGKDFLREDEGMLFIHNGPERYSYSMREMRFSLDFIFIKDDMIVDVIERIDPDYKGNIMGSVEYDKVLEINGGMAKKMGFKKGDKVILN